jgi:hypothetical protein
MIVIARATVFEFVSIRRHHSGYTACRRCLAWPFVPRFRAFFLAFPRRPFRDDTQATSETHDFHRPPARRAVAAAIDPCRFKPCQE